MNIDELIKKLEELREEHGANVAVYFIDNGDFVENGGAVEPDPQFCKGVIIL